MQHTFM